MPFKRVILPPKFLTGEELTAAMNSIGMRLATNTKVKNPNIEDVLLSASIEGLAGDYRVLSLVVDWFFIHFPLINVDRLTKALMELKELKDHKELVALWTALAQTTKHDARFTRLKMLQRGASILGGETSKQLLKKNGPDNRFEGTCIKVPYKLLRARQEDILPLIELAKMHRGIFNRVLIGPSYRADILTLLEADSDLAPSILAKSCYSSFKTAWDTKKDWAVLAHHGKEAS